MAKLFTRTSIAGPSLSGSGLLTAFTTLFDALRSFGISAVSRSTVTASATLTTTQCGILLVDASAGNVVLTLPSSGADTDGAVYNIRRIDSTVAYSVTVQRGGTDSLEGATTAVTVGPGGTLDLKMPEGATNWRITGRSGGTQQGAREALGVGAINFRNRAVNGRFMVSQENGTSAKTVNSTTRTYGLDQWYGQATSAAGVFTLTQVADSLRPGEYRMKISVTTADASIAAGDRYSFGTPLEGNDVADWGLGTSYAETITISFEIESEITGTFGIRVANAAVNRSYVGTFTVNAINTRETKYITLTLDTSGTWATGTSEGMRVDICLAAGSTYQTTAGAWAGGDYLTTSSL